MDEKARLLFFLGVGREKGRDAFGPDADAIHRRLERGQRMAREVGAVFGAGKPLFLVVANDARSVPARNFDERDARIVQTGRADPGQIDRFSAIELGPVGGRGGEERRLVRDLLPFLGELPAEDAGVGVAASGVSAAGVEGSSGGGVGAESCTWGGSTVGVP